jgi:hypothetical protein
VEPVPPLAGAADEAVLNIIHKKKKSKKNPPFTSALMFRGVMVVYGGTGSPFGLTTSNNVVACNLETGNFHRYGIPFFQQN